MPIACQVVGVYFEQSHQPNFSISLWSFQKFLLERIAFMLTSVLDHFTHFFQNMQHVAPTLLIPILILFHHFVDCHCCIKATFDLMILQERNLLTGFSLFSVTSKRLDIKLRDSSSFWELNFCERICRICPKESFEFEITHSCKKMTAKNVILSTCHWNDFQVHLSPHIAHCCIFWASCNFLACNRFLVSLRHSF